MTARTEKDNERLQTIVLSCAKYEYFGGNQRRIGIWRAFHSAALVVLKHLLSTVSEI